MDHSSLVTVGTYQYYPDENVRKGRLYLMEVSEGMQMVEKGRVETDGILDVKWNGNVASLAQVESFKDLNERTIVIWVGWLLSAGRMRW